MDKIIILYLFVFSLFGLVAKGSAQLYCFECSNCPNVNELDTNMIQNCDLQDPDITTTTDPDITTTTDPDITTTTNPDITTTSEPDITTTTEAEVTTITAPSVIPSTTSQMPTSSDDTTTSTTNDGPTTQTTPAMPPTTTSQTPGPPPSMGHNYRRFMQRQQVGGHQCYVIHRQVGDGVQVNRGCAITRGNESETCIAANLGEPYEYCRLCGHNECNVASKYVLSLTFVLSSLFVALL